MAYTNTWSEAIPSGGADPGTIDDQIRQLRLDLRERMNDVVADWTADPVVPKSQKKTGVILLIPGIAAQPYDDEDDVLVRGLYIEADNSLPNDLFIPLHVPKNWKILTVNALVDKLSATQVDIGFHRGSYTVAGPGDTTVGAVIVSAAGFQDALVFSGNETTDGDDYYWLKFGAGSAARFRIYGAKIVYDEV